jgi:predicted PurR-regulated permease PerM
LRSRRTVNAPVSEIDRVAIDDRNCANALQGITRGGVSVSIFLALTHHWIQATILVSIGALIISTLDNFLYPILVGAQLGLHTITILLSILGGIWLLEISGLVLGPVAFTLAESLLAIWRQRSASIAQPMEMVEP